MFIRELPIGGIEMQQTKMQKSPGTQLETPRVENSSPLLIAGLRNHFADEPWKGTPELWQRFAAYLGKIPGQVGGVAYGLCFLQPNGIDYVAGVEVSGLSGLLSHFTAVNIPAGKYLVFPHREHVWKLHITCDMISKWLPTSGYEAAKAAGAPDFFERYSEEFNPSTGMGGVEVWVPIKA
jgi:AraC family transcriptional regulator